MVVFVVIHLSVNLLIALVLSFILLGAPLQRWSLRRRAASRGGSSELPIFAGIYLVGTAAPCFLIGYFWGLGAATFVSACLFMHWAYAAYFSCQRYSDALNQPFVVGDVPALLPLSVAAGSLSYVLAALLYASWYVAFVPVAVWAVYGVVFAELAIARLERQGLTRQLAIGRLKYPNGPPLHSLFTDAGPKWKYPFP